MEPLPRFFPLERVIAFSDGVFAVVITILVLGIEVPSDVALDPAAMSLAREKFLHQLLAYVVAFGLIAMYWTHHSISSWEKDTMTGGSFSCLPGRI